MMMMTTMTLSALGRGHVDHAEVDDILLFDGAHAGQRLLTLQPTLLLPRSNANS